MGNCFYEVKFDNVEESNFFKYHEDAAAFLLEAYFDDNDVLEEEYIMDVNNQVADNDEIEGYGRIIERWFDD